MVSILQRESKLFTKVPGGYFPIVCGIYFLASVVVAVILHSLTIPVNLFMHFVSSMGIGPNGSAIALNVGLLVLAFGLYPLIIHLYQLLWLDTSDKKARLNNRLLTFAFVLAMICVPGLIMTALFTMAPETLLFHGIGAMLIFVGTMIFGTSFWIALERHKQSSLALRACTTCVFIFFGCMMGAMIALVVSNPMDFQALMANPGQYIIALLGNMTDTKLNWVRFIEWFYISSIVLWSMSMGLRSINIAHERKKARV